MTETPPSPLTPPARANGRAADAERIASGYDSTGSALEMGAVLLDGTSYPQARIRVPLAMVNRHGLIAGATGTGKTKTLQVLTEQLSAAGVPVVVADIKGDLSGLAQAGAPTTGSPSGRSTPVMTGRQRPTPWTSWPSAAWVPARRCGPR